MHEVTSSKSPAVKCGNNWESCRGKSRAILVLQTKMVEFMCCPSKFIKSIVEKGAWTVEKDKLLIYICIYSFQFEP